VSKNLTLHGHGHVVPRFDGAVARCGGPVICKTCALEMAQWESEKKAFTDEVTAKMPDPRDVEIDRLRAALKVSVEENRVTMATFDGLMNGYGDYFNTSKVGEEMRRLRSENDQLQLRMEAVFRSEASKDVPNSGVVTQFAALQTDEAFRQIERLRADMGYWKLRAAENFTELAALQREIEEAPVVYACLNRPISEIWSPYGPQELHNHRARIIRIEEIK
jgi:hypothetical protein